MKKFVLVYYGGTKPEDMNPDDAPAVMKQWEEWYKTLGDKLVDGGNPFASNGQRIDATGVAAIGDDEWPAKGYTIVQAEDIEAAVKMAQSNPMLADDDDTVQVRVYECLPM